jgi:hypothetical protein
MEKATPGRGQRVAWLPALAGLVTLAIPTPYPGRPAAQGYLGVRFISSSRDQPIRRSTI